jgi:hypothetical protein
MALYKQLQQKKKKLSVMAVTGQISIEIGHLSNMTLILSQ